VCAVCTAANLAGATHCDVCGNPFPGMAKPWVPPPAGQQPCKADCSLDHPGPAICVVCAQNWGKHAGHSCTAAAFAGQRGSFITVLPPPFHDYGGDGSDYGDEYDGGGSDYDDEYGDEAQPTKSCPKCRAPCLFTDRKCRRCPHVFPSAEAEMLELAQTIPTGYDSEELRVAQGVSKANSVLQLLTFMTDQSLAAPVPTTIAATLQQLDVLVPGLVPKTTTDAAASSSSSSSSAASASSSSAAASAPVPAQPTAPTVPDVVVPPATANVYSLQIKSPPGSGLKHSKNPKKLDNIKDITLAELQVRGVARAGNVYLPWLSSI
jgi:hypothetical protein